MVAAAAVSKKDFYRLFGDLDTCILATYRLAAEDALAAGRTACGAVESADAIRAGALGLLEFAAAERELAHVLSDPALLGQSKVARARREAVARFAQLLASAAASSDPSARALHRAAHLVRGTERWLFWRLEELAGDSRLGEQATELAQVLELGRGIPPEADART